MTVTCPHGFIPECTFCWNERRRNMQFATCVERGVGSVQDAEYDDMDVKPADSDSDVTIFGHLIPCGHTHYKGCEPCGCREYRDVTERSQDEGVDVRTRSELSQSADEDTTPTPADPDTVTRADRLRAVAQQAHDNGDCVCCLPDEMVEFESAEQDTITITISREAAERFARYYDRCDDDCTAGPCEMHKIVSAALEGEK